MRPTSSAESEPTDPALREDVRRLGALVGQVLVEQMGEAFFARVEAARTAAIARRRDGSPLTALAGQLAGLDAATAQALARAFSLYFQLVNVAERVQRIRRRRAWQIAGATPQPDGLHEVLLRLRETGVDAASVLATLPRLDVEPVLTAHPTEVSRRALLEKEQEIVRTLIDDLVGPHTPAERRAGWARLRMAVTSGWQTADTTHERPGVLDELDHVDYYLAEPIYRVIPVFYEALEQAMVEVYGTCPALPRVVRFANWVGGDMDGNPNANAGTIAAALRQQRRVVIARYRAECAQLARLLSQTLDRVGVGTAVQARLEEYRTLLPQAAARIRPRHANMPYRSLLQLMGARLAATAHDQPHGYADAAQFTRDIEAIADSLRENAGAHAGWFAVRRLLWRSRSFGFHLARLDTRQDARAHARVLGAALGTWPATASERAALLAPYASGARTLVVDPADQPLVDAAAVFATLADARARHGDDALGLHIISMASCVADLLGVLALARAGRLVAADGHVPLDIAPLFETITDLRAAATTLRALLDEPVYRAHLAARGDRQVVMLGYSDSAKDGGILAARFALQRAQVELLEAARAAGVRIEFFHGRGGSVSRGGGKTSRAVMAAPRGAIDAHLRVTEQGEIIHQKYAIRALALRTLEQSVGAVLLATLRPRAPEPREARWRELMQVLAAHGERSWRELLESAGFVDYFRLATPIDVIERMTLGSRPARRGGNSLDALRAIPWVFAWTQSRAGLTAWYGVGSAIDALRANGQLDMLREMARDWAFFRTLLEDLEMQLAKCDLDIAERFSQLAGPLHERFFPRIRTEFERSVSGVLRLRQRERLLADDPRLAQSIALRNPYIDPISLVQLDLLRRWRASEDEDAGLFAALAASVHGVALGLQNSG
ncbi:MAG: phosphoenolpyruvate carboxylase [Xanthomonadales bacterium]|nr:phosphoenolpyruvate carboxylase [Xanthomonadales bacterium]MDL1868241.1 phosphoenolpyruvate carboxylase [Gammaproteobacteria bacterium PRO6]